MKMRAFLSYYRIMIICISLFFGYFVHATLNISDYFYHSHHRHAFVENLKSHPHTALTTKDFMITSFTMKVLESIIDSQDNNHVLYYVIKQSQIQHIDNEFLQLLDDFIAPRLWLKLLHVTMHDNHHIINNINNNINDNTIMNKDTSTSNSESNLLLPTIDYIILEKVPPQLFESLEVLSRKSFPLTQEECKDRPLVAHLLMGTWGNDYRQMSGYLNGRPQVIVYIFSSRRGKSTDSTSFNIEGECMDKVNKHQCLFLPTTNCKLPEEVVNLSFFPIVDNTYYLSADPSAQSISEKNRNIFNDKIQSKHKFTFPKTAPLMVFYDHYNLNPKFAYQITGTAPYIDISDSNTYTHTMRKRDLNGIVSYKGSILRQNAEFKLHTQKLVEIFRTSTHPHFTSNMTCIWAHARKGDRILPDEYDMIEWCKTHTKYISDHEYKPIGLFKRNNQSHDEVVSDGDVYDLGCQMALPYGGASLEHFLNASLILAPNNRNIYLSTDDEEWLTKAIIEYKSQTGNLISQKNLQIFRFHPKHHNHRNIPSKTTASDFFATIELGQQCEGFVGYTEASAVAQLFYDSMCYYHRYTYLQCPPSFNLGVEYKTGKKS